MKYSVKKILLFVFLKKKIENEASKKEQLYILVPELSSSGKRSLISYLKKNQYLLEYQINNTKFLSLSKKAYREISVEMPFILRTEWQGEWMMMIFNKAPLFDKNFRNLHKQLIKIQARLLQRSVYLYPAPLPDLFLDNLRNDYQNNLFLFTIQQVDESFNENFYFDQKEIQDLLNIYSGISKELNDLLASIKLQNRGINSIKKVLVSCYERLTEYALKENGVIKYYFPTVQSSEELFKKWFECLEIIYQQNN